jgi:hypothetical protein
MEYVYRKNFEKAFYYLLCRYRDKSFEEYNMDVPYDPFSATSPFSTPSSPVPLSPRRSGDFDLYASRAGAASPIQRHFPGRVGARTSLVLDDPAAIASVFPPTPDKKRRARRDEHGKSKTSASRPVSPKKTPSPKNVPAASPKKPAASASKDRASSIRAPTLGAKVPTSTRSVPLTPPRSQPPQARGETKPQSKPGVRGQASTPRPSVVAPPPTARNRSGPPVLMAPPPIPDVRASVTSAAAVHPTVPSPAPATRTAIPPVMIHAPVRRNTEPVPSHQLAPLASMPPPLSQNQPAVDAASLGLVLPKTPDMCTSSPPSKTELDKTPRPLAPVRATTVPTPPSKPTAMEGAGTPIGVVSGSGSDVSDKWEKIDQVSQELINLPAGLARKQSAKAQENMLGGYVKVKRRSKRTCIFEARHLND